MTRKCLRCRGLSSRKSTKSATGSASLCQDDCSNDTLRLQPMGLQNKIWSEALLLIKRKNKTEQLKLQPMYMFFIFEIIIFNLIKIDLIYLLYVCMYVCIYLLTYVLLIYVDIVCNCNLFNHLLICFKVYVVRRCVCIKHTHIITLNLVKIFLMTVKLQQLSQLKFQCFYFDSDYRHKIRK